MKAGFNQCPYCNSNNCFVNETRIEDGDCCLLDWICHDCKRDWTTEMTPIVYYRYSENGDFNPTPQHL